MLRCVIVGLVVSFGCSDAPTSPTPVVIAPTVDTIPAQYDDRMWRELVFNGYDIPGGVSTARSVVLTAPVIPAWKMSVQLVDHPWLTDDRYRLIARVIRDTLFDVTRHTWGGPYRIVPHASRDEPPGTLSIWFHDEADHTTWTEVCGLATTGEWPAEIDLVATDDGCSIERTLTHELLHVLGFHHVSAGSLRYPTPSLLWHAQLAYDVGRGQRYCGGWPVDAC